MKQVNNKVLWIFAVGQFGWSLLSGIVVSWLVFYYQVGGENAATFGGFITQGYLFWVITLIGLITACGRIFDAVTDPMIASLSDNCKHKSGRRIPFMRVAAVPFAIITVLVFFSPINGTSWVNNVWLFVFLILFYLFMTIYCTPYNALIPELGKTQKDRVNVSTFISFTYIAGASVAYLVPNIAGFLKGGLGEVWSIRVAIIILATIGLICLLVPAFFIKEKEYINVKPCKTPAFKSLLQTFKNKEFRHFVYSDVIYFFAVTLFQTGLPFYETVLMGLDASYTFLLMVIMTVCSLALYPVVNKLALKMGKKKMISFGFFFYAGVFVLTTVCGLFGIDGIVWGIVIAILAGVPMAILGILPQAVVADISEADAIDTGEKHEGMFFAARTFAMKMGQAISMLVFTSVALIGSNGFGYRLTAIIAAVFCLIGAFIFFLYNEKGIMKKINDAKVNTEIDEENTSEEKNV